MLLIVVLTIRENKIALKCENN